MKLRAADAAVVPPSDPRSTGVGPSPVPSGDSATELPALQPVEKTGAGAVVAWLRGRSLPRLTLPGIIAVALWALVGLLWAAEAPLLAQGHRRSDFGIYYEWGYALRHGIDPYRTDLGPLSGSLGIDTGGIRHANYPAFFILLFEPLTRLGLQRANLVWCCLNLAFLWGSLELLWGEARRAMRPWNYVLWALALLYRPVSSNFYLGQVSVLLLFLLVAALRCSERRRDIAAGCLIGLAGLVKVFPLAVLAVFLLGRRWRVVTAALATVAAGLCLTAAALGVAPTLGFLHTLDSVIDRQRFEFESTGLISLNAFITRLLLSSQAAAAGLFADRATQRLVVAGVSLVVVGLSTLATWNARSARELSAGFALWAVTAILVSPPAWHHYEVLLLIPFALVLRDRLQVGEARAAAAAAVASYVLTQVTWFWQPLAGAHRGGWPAFFLDEGFFLSLLLGYAAAALLRLSAARPAAAPGAAAGAESSSALLRYAAGNRTA